MADSSRSSKAPPSTAANPTSPQQERKETPSNALSPSKYDGMTDEEINQLPWEERLYFDSLRRDRERARLEKENPTGCTFRPQLVAGRRPAHEESKDVFSGLYEKAQALKEKLAAKARKYRDPELTFKPRVNKRPTSAKSATSRDGGNPGDRLYDEALKSRRRLEELKAKVAEDEKRRMPFKPSITKKGQRSRSRSLSRSETSSQPGTPSTPASQAGGNKVRPRSVSSDKRSWFRGLSLEEQMEERARREALRQHAEKVQAEQEQKRLEKSSTWEMQECTFKPHINRSSRVFQVRKPESGAVYDRLYSTFSRSQLKLQQAAEEKEQQEKQRLTFKPKLLTSKYNSRLQTRQLRGRSLSPSQVSATPAYDRLYEDSKRRQQKLEAEKLKQEQEYEFKPKLSKGTQQMAQVALQRSRGFDSIGNNEVLLPKAMEGGESERENMDSAARENSPARFSPARPSSASQAETRELLGSAVVFDRLHKDADRQELWRQAAKKEIEDDELNDCTFKPEINEVSKSLASTQRGDDTSPVFLRLYREAEAASYLKELRERHRLQNELRDCTFKPSTSQFPASDASSTPSRTRSFSHDPRRSGDYNVYDALYVDAEARRKARAEIKSAWDESEVIMYGFKPRISQKSQELARRTSAASTTGSEKKPVVKSRPRPRSAKPRSVSASGKKVKVIYRKRRSKSKISTGPKSVASSTASSQGHTDLFERLYRQGKQKQSTIERLERLRREMEKELTFKPTVSKLPHQQSTPEDSESLYDRLYQNGVAKAAEKRSEEPSPAVKEPEHFDQPAVFTRLDSKPDPRRPAFRPTGSFRTRVSSSPEPSVAPRRRTVTETEKQEIIERLSKPKRVNSGMPEQQPRKPSKQPLPRARSVPPQRKGTPAARVDLPWNSEDRVYLGRTDGLEAAMQSVNSRSKLDAQPADEDDQASKVPEETDTKPDSTNSQGATDAVLDQVAPEIKMDVSSISESDNEKSAALSRAPGSTSPSAKGDVSPSGNAEGVNQEERKEEREGSPASGSDFEEETSRDKQLVLAAIDSDQEGEPGAAVPDYDFDFENVFNDWADGEYPSPIKGPQVEYGESATQPREAEPQKSMEATNGEALQPHDEALARSTKPSDTGTPDVPVSPEEIEAALALSSSGLLRDVESDEDSKSQRSISKRGKVKRKRKVKRVHRSGADSQPQAQREKQASSRSLGKGVSV